MDICLSEDSPLGNIHCVVNSSTHAFIFTFYIHMHHSSHSIPTTNINSLVGYEKSSETAPKLYLQFNLHSLLFSQPYVLLNLYNVFHRINPGLFDSLFPFMIILQSECPFISICMPKRLVSRIGLPTLKSWASQVAQQ